jgi:hypothetical protein
MSRRTIFLAAAAAVTIAAGSLPADAAMPVSGAQQAGAAGDIVLAQAPPTAPAATQEQTAAPAKKKGSKKMTPRQEAEQSAQSGTVPKRYMQNVPKEYHHLIPFSK